MNFFPSTLSTLFHTATAYPKLQSTLKIHRNEWLNYLQLSHLEAKMFTQAWGDLPPEGMVKARSSWDEIVCRALMGIANKTKISLSIILKTKRAVGCFFTQLRAKSLHAGLLCILGSELGGQQYLEEIPEVQECCREGGFPTRVCGGTGRPCTHRGGTAQPCHPARVGAVLQLYWEVLRIHRLQLRYSFNHHQSTCGLFHNGKKKDDFFSPF